MVSRRLACLVLLGPNGRSTENTCQATGDGDMIIVMLQKLIEDLIMNTARRRSFDRGAFLFHRGDQVQFVFVIAEGAVELVRPQSDGSEIILQRAGTHALLAEASIYSKTYHCDALAVEQTTAFIVSRRSFLEHLRANSKYSEMWASYLAKEVQAARYRSEILSRKTVAKRLDAWLDWQGVDLPAKGEWRGLAAQIAVSPEALYRELCKRRKSA